VPGPGGAECRAAEQRDAGLVEQAGGQRVGVEADTGDVREGVEGAARDAAGHARH
jgi:hypothetical protein